METDDVNEKAKAFFLLWQEQVATLARDPEAMATALKALLAVQETYYQPKEMKQENATDTSPQPHTVSAGPDMVADTGLATRLAQCEKRIAELESALAKRSKPVGKRPAGRTAQ